MKRFEETKRDLFLTEEMFDAKMDFWPKSFGGNPKYAAKLADGLPDPVDNPGQKKRISDSRACDSLEMLILRYSAGEAIEPLQAFAKDVVFAEFERHFKMFPEDVMFLREQDAYQYCLWLLGLAVLFDLPTMPAKIATWFSQKPEDGQDPLIHALFARLGVTDFARSSELLHPKPYSHLWDAVRGDPFKLDSFDRAPALVQYLKAWYKGTKSCYWHNNHKNSGNIHFGYWAFETGMVALLYGVDDSTLRGLTFYPKDLVNYARTGNYAAHFEPGAFAPPTLSAMPGQICPRSGTWITTAMVRTRSLQMTAGERMPSEEYDLSGNGVIWYWKQT